MPRLFFVFSLLISVPCFCQQINSDNQHLNDAFKLAVQTIDINTRRGILAAGGDYGGEWTRDIAINSWNAASLLRPKIAEASLWSITINRDTIGHQYWDKIIWTIAVLNHYKATGNTSFLQQAYTCSANTIAQLEKQAFDAAYGLFTGPSVFNDGIAAYPEPVYEKTNNSSYVLDHTNSKFIKCLSTNCLYYGAYRSLVEMGHILNKEETVNSHYETSATALKKNILGNLYRPNENKFNYLIDNNGKADSSQEALGISFAILFGVISKEQAYKVTQHVVTSKFGITSIYPDFPRYSPQKPGRHNNIVWPMVNGFFAQASIVAGDTSAFNKELNSLTSLTLDENKGDYNFREIYNPYTGAPDGGWQANGDQQPDFHWPSMKLQTWSATAFLNMVLYGLAGLRLQNDGIRFAPYLPAPMHYLELKSINYRDSVLNIVIKGSGSTIKSFSLNGKSYTQPVLNSKIKGVNNITIVLK